MNDPNKLTEKQLNELLLITRESINESLLNIKENSNLFELYFPDVKTPLHYINDNMYDNEACYGNNEVNETKNPTDQLFLTTKKIHEQFPCESKKNSNLPESVVYQRIETGKKEKGTLCIQCNIKEKAKNRLKCYPCIYRNRIEKNPKKEKITLCIECNINEKKKYRTTCSQCIYRNNIAKNFYKI